MAIRLNMLLLFTFLATITVGTAIKCYMCAGSERGGCAKGKKSDMAIINCNAASSKNSTRFMLSYFDPSTKNKEQKFQPICLKLDEKVYGSQLFVRTCGNFPTNIDPCTFLEKHVPITACKSCTTDLCNDGEQYYEDDILATD